MRRSIAVGVLLAGLLLGMPGSGVAAEIITIRVGHAQPTKDVFHLGSVKFKEVLEQKMKGRVRVQVFPSGQLGNIRDMVEGLRVGTIQVVMDAPSRLSVYTPLGDVFKLPYLVENRAQGEKAWASPVGAEAPPGHCRQVWDHDGWSGLAWGPPYHGQPRDPDPGADDGAQHPGPPL